MFTSSHSKAYGTVGPNFSVRSHTTIQLIKWYVVQMAGNHASVAAVKDAPMQFLCNSYNSTTFLTFCILPPPLCSAADVPGMLSGALTDTHQATDLDRIHECSLSSVITNEPSSGTFHSPALIATVGRENEGNKILTNTISTRFKKGEYET